MFKKMQLEKLWIAFSTGNYDIGESIGDEKSSVLYCFHAFIGCDQTSTFYGRDKVTAFNTWMNYNEVTTVFRTIGNSPKTDDVMGVMSLIEPFVVLLYDRTSTYYEHVNEARKNLFAQKGKSIESIPPTYDALIQHVNRVDYQAGFCLNFSLKKIQDLPSPSEWG